MEGQHLKEMHELRNDLPFLPERKKIKKVKKRLTNIYDKKRIS